MNWMKFLCVSVAQGYDVFRELPFYSNADVKSFPL